MILGCVKCRKCQEALELFRQIQQEGVQPDFVTSVGVLNACASVVALEEGSCVHEQIIQSGQDSDVFVGEQLGEHVCKDVGTWRMLGRVFEKMPSQGVVTQNAILGGCAMHQYAKEAIKQFEQMREEGVQPDDINLVCLLSACSDVGFGG